jgi:cytoskeletal protein CcmA (bactofilin family)
MRNRKDTMATGASSGGTTLISSETTIKGDITFTGQLDVEGTIVGSIQSGAGDAVLRVVSGGRVSGEIKVAHATVNG